MASHFNLVEVNVSDDWPGVVVHRGAALPGDVQPTPALPPEALFRDPLGVAVVQDEVNGSDGGFVTPGSAALAARRPRPFFAFPKNAAAAPGRGVSRSRRPSPAECLQVAARGPAPGRGGAATPPRRRLRVAAATSRRSSLHVATSEGPGREYIPRPSTLFPGVDRAELRVGQVPRLRARDGHGLRRPEPPEKGRRARDALGRPRRALRLERGAARRVRGEAPRGIRPPSPEPNVDGTEQAESRGRPPRPRPPETARPLSRNAPREGPSRLRRSAESAGTTRTTSTRATSDACRDRRTRRNSSWPPRPRSASTCWTRSRPSSGEGSYPQRATAAWAKPSSRPRRA